MAIYRTTVRTTGSLQPGGCGTFWTNEVLYCGTDLEDARVEYLESIPHDKFRGFGGPARETWIQEFASEPEMIDDDEDTCVAFDDEVEEEEDDEE